MKNKKQTSEIQFKCPICKEVMEEYKFAYDNRPTEKINYKCPVCGHKDFKMV